MRDVTSEAMDDDVTIVEEVRPSDFNPSYEHLRCIGRRSYRQASSGKNRLDFGAEHQFLEIIERVEARNSVLLKKERD